MQTNQPNIELNLEELELADVIYGAWVTLRKRDRLNITSADSAALEVIGAVIFSVSNYLRNMRAPHPQDRTPILTEVIRRVDSELNAQIAATARSRAEAEAAAAKGRDGDD